MSGVEGEARAKERSALYEQEMSIDDYKVEAEVETCMTDFHRKPYGGVDEYPVSIEERNEHLVPIDYYDNDDGFWDDYIKEKQHRSEKAGFLTHRRFFKH